MPQSGGLKFHGGKRYLADWIVSHMSPHTRYVEPYFGGGSVLLRKPCEGIAEFINDINGELCNFWATLIDAREFSKFMHVMSVIPLGKPFYEDAMRKATNADNDTRRAIKYFVKMRQSRQGLGKDYCTPTSRTRRGMNENVSAWLSAVDGLPDLHARLRRVEIWDRKGGKALDCIKALDGYDTLFYLDPPYLPETRSSQGEYGEYEMTKADHYKLLTLLTTIDGKFLLSGYPSPMYENFREKNGWQMVSKPVHNQASSKRKKEKDRVECLWANYPLSL